MASRELTVGVIALTLLCASFATILMSQNLLGNFSEKTNPGDLSANPPPTPPYPPALTVLTNYTSSFYPDNTTTEILSSNNTTQTISTETVIVNASSHMTLCTEPNPSSGQLQVLSTGVVNSSIGSPLAFYATFTNLGPCPIIFNASPLSVWVPCSGQTGVSNVRITTTSITLNTTSELPGCHYTLPLHLDSSFTGSSPDCVPNYDLSHLDPGKNMTAWDNYCNDWASWTITSQGSFEARLTIQWAPVGSPDMFATSIMQVFNVG